MDPQKLSQLDPKLRDVYQRIMGTQVSNPQAAAAPVPPQQNTPPVQARTFVRSTPQIEIQPQPIPPVQPPIFAQPNQVVQPNPVFQMNPQIPTPAVTATPNFAPPPPAPPVQAQGMTMEKKGGSIKFILFGIVFLVFLVIYTLFWAKVFNLKLPFLP
jgi:hypothetical protein